MLHTIKAYCTKRNIKILLITLCIVAFYLFFGCPIRLVCGVCCPGCGMTRAVLALLRLDPAAAWHFHPLVFLMPVAVVIFLLRKRLSNKALYCIAGCFLLVFLAVYIYRLLAHSDIVYIQVEQSLLGKIYQFIRQYI